jgi:site-specific recombinase XerD
MEHRKMTTSLALFDALNIFLLDCEARRFTPATREYYRYNLTAFVIWATAQGIFTLADVTTNTVRAYLAKEEGRNLSGYTVLAIARALRAWLNFCVREEWLAASPMGKGRIRMPKVDKDLLPAFLLEDIERLLKACPGARERALVFFLLDTGARASEALAVTLGDIDLAAGSVLIRKGKGRKQRIVYLGAKARRHLLKYLAARGKLPISAPLWQSQLTGKALTRNGLSQLLQRLGRRAQVTPCTAHMFRRTFALYCLRNGMDIYTLQRLMGHEDLTVLRRYLALVEADLQTAHRRFGVVDNL